jgi:citrate lyase subunit beta-like protein
MDMEDGVALNRKTEARHTIAEALQTLDFGRSERLARINAIGSGFEAEDLATVLPARPDGIVIPKVETAEQIRWVSGIIATHEAHNGWPVGEICLLVVVETARGIINLTQIAAADPRLQAIIFGAEDFAGDIGATRTPDGWEVFYARSAVVTHTAAFDLQAIDMVAFAGKQVIHPNQVAPVQQAFTPSEEAIANARRVIQAFEQNQLAGKGAFALDGKMIDAPILKAAERVIALAGAAGKL